MKPEIDGYKISHADYTGKDALACAIKAPVINDLSGLEYVIFTKPEIDPRVDISAKDAIFTPFAAFRDGIMAAHFATLCDLNSYEIRHKGKVVESYTASSYHNYEGIVLRETRKG